MIPASGTATEHMAKVIPNMPIIGSITSAPIADILM